MPTAKGRSAQHAIGRTRKRNTRYSCWSVFPLAGWRDRSSPCS